ncbi:MAG: M14 family zinc carboxypeptidase [Bacteroidales bacterium]
MKYLQAITALLLIMITPRGYGQYPHRGDDIREAVRKNGQAEVIISYPGFDLMTRVAERFPVSSCSDTEAILCLSHIDAEEFIASGRDYKLIVPEPHKGFFTAASAAEAMLWQSYPTWRHYDTIMHKIADRWSGVCRLDTIGFSVSGRAVLALKISDNPISDETEPAVMLSSSIHGDEPAGFVLLMRLAEYLASESSAGGLASDLVDGLEIWINPLANPDGMYRGNDTMINPVRANSNGYDLNRNFPDPEVASPPPLQKETHDMVAFLEEKRFALSVNLHSGAEVVNYPWDKWTWLHADDDWFCYISRRYADTVHLWSEPGYMSFLDNGVTRGWEWYVVRGGRQDFVTWSLGGREVTIEIDDIKMTPGSNLEALWNWNHRSLLRYIAEALGGVRGTVTDSVTGDPLRARIFIEGHDIDSSHIYADSITGEYYRFIAPGTHSLTFSCPGYVPYTFEATIADWNSAVTRDVRLQRPEYLYPSPPESGLLIWPVPSGGNLSIMLPALITGEVTVTVTGTSGAVIKSLRTNAASGIPVICDCSDLPPGVFIISVRKEPDGPLLRGKAIITRLK